LSVKLFSKDGQALDVNEDQVFEALSSNQYGVPADQQFAVVGPGGRAAGVNGANLLKVLKQGWRLETTEEQGQRYFRGKAQEGSLAAFGAGAARGVTLGLSDWVMTESGMVDPGYLDALREENPGLSITGEVIGGIGSVFIPGGAISKLGTGLARAGLETKTALAVAEALVPARGLATFGAKVGAGVEGLALRVLTGGADDAFKAASLSQRALAKMGALTAAGAVEGSVVGLGQVITEHALGNPETVGEALTAHIGPAAIVGGIAGGLFGGVAALGGAALQKMTKKAEQGIADFIGTEAPTIRTKTVFQALGLNPDVVSRKLGEKKTLEAVDTLLDPDLLGDGHAIVKPGAKSDEVLQRIRTASERYGQNISVLINGADEVVARMGDDAGEKLIPQGEHIAAALYLKADQLFLGKRPYKKAYDELQRVAKEFADGGPMPFVEAQAQKVAYGVAFDAKDVLKGSKLDAWRVAYHTIRDELEAATEEVYTKGGMPDMLNLLNKSRKVYRDIRDVAEMADDQWLRASESWAAEAAKRGVEFVRGLTQRMLFFGRTGAGAVKGAAMAVGMRQVFEAGAGFMRPSKIANMANDTAKLRAVQQQVEAFAKRIDDAVEGLLTAKTVRIAAPTSVRILRDHTETKNDVEAMRTMRDEMAQLTNPDVISQHVAMSLQGLEEVAPTIAVSVAATSTKAVQVIRAAMPQTTYGPTLQPDVEDMELSPGDLSEFKQVVAACFDPASVLDDAAQGICSPKAIDAVAQVYPMLLDAWRASIAERLAEKKERIPYQLRTQLSVLFSMPTDPTLESDFLLRSQLAWAQARSQPAPDQRGSPPRFTDSKIKDNTHLTSSQRLEANV
jgi:hypothetical protein